MTIIRQNDYNNSINDINKRNHDSYNRKNREVVISLGWVLFNNLFGYYFNYYCVAYGLKFLTKENEGLVETI